jgi:hypothetical protein
MGRLMLCNKRLYAMYHNHPYARHWGWWGKYNASHGLRLSVLENNWILVDYYLKKGVPSSWSVGFLAACEGGHINLVEQFIENGANDFDEGLKVACTHNRVEVATMLIVVYNARVHEGFYCAITGGHLNLVRLLVDDFGVMNPLGGIRAAFTAKRTEVMKYLASRVSIDDVYRMFRRMRQEIPAALIGMGAKGDEGVKRRKLL